MPSVVGAEAVAELLGDANVVALVPIPGRSQGNAEVIVSIEGGCIEEAADPVPVAIVIFIGPIAEANPRKSVA